MVHIYLTEVEGGGDFEFPSLPEKVDVSHGTKYQSYSIINLGEIKIPKGNEVSSMKWAGKFYGSSKKKMTYLGTWMKPDTCIKTLRKWMEKGKVLRLLVTGTPINFDVTIAKFDYSVSGMMDYSYTITFNRYRELKIYTTSEREITTYEKKTTTRVTPEEGTANVSYSVVSGDSLWGLARTKLGDGSRWKEIYDANQKVIEQTAKKYGNSSAVQGSNVLIYPGEKLVIPSGKPT